MSLAYTHERLQLPEGLQRQLHEFRRRVWTIKMVEAACAAVFAIMAAYLLMFLMDRAWDTPVWLRATLLAAAVSVVRGCRWPSTDGSGGTAAWISSRSS